MRARAVLAVVLATVLIATSCAGNSSYVRAARYVGGDISAECDAAEAMLIDSDTYDFTGDAASSMDEIRTLDDVDPELAELFVELGSVGYSLDGVVRALEIAAEIDSVSNRECEFPLMSAMMVMLDAALTEMRCISSASGCGRSSVRLPESLPCFERSDEPVGVYELQYIAIDCSSGEPTRWDASDGEWVVDDDPLREREMDQFGGGVLADDEYDDWEYPDDEECVPESAEDRDGTLRLSSPRLAGGRVLGLTACSVVGLNADGNSVDWEVSCDYSWWVGSTVGVVSEIAVVQCDDAVMAIDAGTGAPVWRGDVSSHVYSWAVEADFLALQQDDGEIQVVAMSTGEVVASVQAAYVESLALSSEALFYATDESVHRVSLASGEPEVDQAFAVADMAMANGRLYVRTWNHIVTTLNQETLMPEGATSGGDERNLTGSYFVAADTQNLALLGWSPTAVLSVFDATTTELKWVLRDNVSGVVVGEGVVAAALEDEAFQSVGMVILDATTGDELVRLDVPVYGAPVILDGWIYYSVWDDDVDELRRMPMPL